MMAKWYQMAISACPPRLLEKMCAMPTAKAGAPPVRLKSVCSPTACARAAMSAAVTGNPQAVMVADGGFGRWPDDPGRAIDREVDAGLQHAGRNHGHDRDQRFEQHAAVADQARLGLAADQFRSGAAGDQGVKSADGAAGDGDKSERKDLPAKTGPVPSMNRVSAGMCSDGRNTTIPIASSDDRPQLHERAEVVARREQQPHRQRGRANP